MLQSMVAAAERVFEFLEEKEEVEDVQNPKSTENLKGNVTFDHVQFGYDEEEIESFIPAELRKMAGNCDTNCPHYEYCGKCRTGE